MTEYALTLTWPWSAVFLTVTVYGAYRTAVDIWSATAQFRQWIAKKRQA